MHATRRDIAKTEMISNTASMRLARLDGQLLMARSAQRSSI